MNTDQVTHILDLYGIQYSVLNIQPIGSGLIHGTWKIDTGDRRYILQRINTQVFRQPEAIAYNLSLLSDHYAQHHPGVLFASPVRDRQGDTMICLQDQYYRIFPFIEGSHTIDTVSSPEQAYEAAKAFGGFTKDLSSLDANDLHTTIPQFHDLSLRYQQFKQALIKGDRTRIATATAEISEAQQYRYILDTYEQIIHDPQFRLRVTHHDTKISNVLFDDNDKAICVIDLDTVMPGYFISDLGDMIRTYVCLVNEESDAYADIRIRETFLAAVTEGYLFHMKDELTAKELAHLFYSGEYMIWMQALRFLTDHLNNDVYYGAAYEGHNLVRAKNQLQLLKVYTGHIR